MLTLLHSKDHAACACLFKEIYTGAPWYHATVTEEKALRYIREMSETPGFLGFIRRDGPLLVGMVLGTVNDYFFEPQYEIKELAVAPAYQRKGFGTRMLAETEAALKARGVAYVQLQTSREIPAYEFYRQSGYLPIDATVSMAKEIKK